MPRLHVFDGSSHQSLEFPSLSRAPARVAVRRRVLDPGVALIQPEELDLGPADGEDLQAIAASFDALAPDPYDSTRMRYRAHGELSLQTNAGFPVAVRLDQSSYRQSSIFNSAAGGRARLFPHLPESLFPLLFWRVVCGILEYLPESIRQTPTLRVQIHQLSYRAGSQPAVAPSLGLHRDGEPFTAVVLVSARDLWGGDSIVANDFGQLVLGHALRRPLEILLLNDAAVLHAVTPVLRGRRDVLLIDYTPMVPDVPK